MSRKEVPRAGLLKAALAAKISNAQGALALHLSVRQFQRVKRRYAADGAPGLLHRLRGRRSPRRLAPEQRAWAAALLQHRYDGLNDCHATEKLRELEGLRLSRSSVRRLRRALGQPAKQGGPSPIHLSIYPHGAHIVYMPAWVLSRSSTLQRSLGDADNHPSIIRCRRSVRNVGEYVLRRSPVIVGGTG